MIGAFLDLLRQATGQNVATIDDEAWKQDFEELLARSQERPRLLVDFARAGFQRSCRGWAWPRILRISEVPGYLRDFDRQIVRLFGTASPIHFQPPCFGSPLELETVIASSTRRDIIKKLLCILGDAHPNLEFAPIIPGIVAVLSKKLEPGDILACVTAMIEGHSIPAYKRQDWAYFPLHRRDYLVFERVFEDLVDNFIPRLAKHLRNIQAVKTDFVPPWDKLLSNFFIGILPRELVLRIFDCYLVEGYKIVLRFAIAHLLVRQDRLLQSADPQYVRNLILEQEEHNSPTLIQTYFQRAFQVKFDRSIIQRYRNRRRKHSVGDFDAKDKLLLFQKPLPHLHKPSSFMTDDNWAALWSWVPARYRLLDLDLTFTTAEHGKHLMNLYDKCAGCEPLLLLIETVAGSIIGAYISKALITSHGPHFYGSGETFLFSLKPNVAKYPWDARSDSLSFICATEAFLAFGSGSDFGLWIDRFMAQVTSSSSTTFRNRPLLDTHSPSDLLIYCAEVFTFA